MHCDFYEFTPTHKFLMTSNHKPTTSEFTVAFWSRIRLIDFGVTIPPDQQDKRLPAKLRAEAEGILAWMVRGCLEWQDVGLNEPPRIREATMDYRDEMDPIGTFIAECCVMEPDRRAASSALFAAYKKWCDRTAVSQGVRVPNDAEFGKILGQKGIQPKRTAEGTMRLGIALKTSSETAENAHEGATEKVDLEGTEQAASGDHVADVMG
jgi:putative DNA primase/helicase